jgi:methylmalonyl-CoA/ethylmalonyl-CoA epimerase
MYNLVNTMFASRVLNSSMIRRAFIVPHRFSSCKSAGVERGNLRLNHVAIAVPELGPARSLYEDALGFPCSGPDRLPEHGVSVVFVDLPNTRIELLEPIDEKSPIFKFLQKNPRGGLHHICLETTRDLKVEIERLEKEHGLEAIDREPKIGAHGNPVVFLHPKSTNGVLLELEKVPVSSKAK